jgi:predicted Zn finger-like uncharacterized protein
MIVTCSSCSTRYLVDPAALGAAGRTVRCANCSSTWFQAPPADAPQPLDLAASEPEPVFRGAGDAGGRRIQLPAVPRRRFPIWNVLGWVAMVAVLAGLMVGAVSARNQVTSLWPPAARLYAMIGFPVAQPRLGLELRKVSPSRGTENGLPTLSIDGEVVNISSVARDVPKLRVALRDGNDHEVQAWTISVTDERLLPGASIPFHTSVTQPNEAATGVVVTFVGGG